VFLIVLGGIALTAVIFGSIRLAARPVPHTMSQEWQEASNEYLKVRFLYSGQNPPFRMVLTLVSSRKIPTLSAASRRLATLAGA
jgi:cytochrome c oxidase subunit 4